MVVFCWSYSCLFSFADIIIPHAPTMRLIRTQNLWEMQEFHGSSTPRYAVLSHTWEEEEVALSDLDATSANPEGTRAKQGYSKLWNFAREAERHGCDYVWMDNCCIDKSSSAELQESLNSMYKWYERSSVCIVYIQDFEWLEGEEDEVSKTIHGRRGRLKVLSSEESLHQRANHKCVLLVWQDVAAEIESIEVVHSRMDAPGAHRATRASFLRRELEAAHRRHR